MILWWMRGEREREVYLEMKYLQRREEKTEAEVNDWWLVEFEGKEWRGLVPITTAIGPRSSLLLPRLSIISFHFPSHFLLIIYFNNIIIIIIYISLRWFRMKKEMLKYIFLSYCIITRLENCYHCFLKCLV